jgi:hypothetical protein
MLMSNGIDEVKLNRYVGEIEKIDDELLSEKMSYVSRCKPYKDRKKDWKGKASDDGIPGSALNRILRERSLLRSIAKNNSDVEDIDEKAFMEEMREKLKPVADLPLFGAAIEAAQRFSGYVAPADSAEPPKAPKGRGKKKDALNSLISDDVPDEAEHANENAARLAGIKELH